MLNDEERINYLRSLIIQFLKGAVSTQSTGMFVEDLNFHRNHFAALKSKDYQMKQKLPSDSALHLSDSNPVCRRESAGGAITNLFIKRL